MPLPTPQLDDRTFDQLVAEARARIPRFTPEWTNFNDADPGMTLVKLHAWLTETILFRLNQIPDLNYIQFLNLLNVQPHPALAARAQLTFKLKKLSDPVSDPLLVYIPKGTQVGVDDPELTQPLTFETDRTLAALNAVVAAVIVPSGGSPPRDQVTEYNADKAEVRFPVPFYPFGSNPAVGAVCLLGILPRPHRQKGKNYSLDRFPAGELDLTAFVPQVNEPSAASPDAADEGPLGMECLFPWQAAAESQQIVWEAYRGTQPASQFPALVNADAWAPLAGMDETAGLARSGHIYLDVPGGLTPVAFAALSRDLWAQLGLHKPPATAGELADDIQGTSGFTLAAEQLDKDTWEQMGLSGTALDSLCAELAKPSPSPSTVAAIVTAAAGLNPKAVAEETWTDLGYDAAPVPYDLVWLRARVVEKPDEAPQVTEFRLNTVAATAAVTRVEEILGTSNGRPGQTLALSRTPVLVDAATRQPDLTLVVTELAGEAETWRVAEDFYGAGPADPVFLLDAQAGVVTFGDGIHGRIPGAGAEVRARRYRYGGGAVGNVGAGAISKLKSALPSVDSVTNLRAAAGGADIEPLSEVMLRAPHDLRMRDRAVTQDDFAALALQTPGVRIQRAYALALTAVDTTKSPPELKEDTPGAVTVVILPENKEDKPQPTEDQLRLVCAHLSSRRLITTELYVVGPRYREISKLELEVTVGRPFDLKVVRDAVIARLRRYFHPLQGGEDGRGWPFGQDVFFGNVYQQALSVPGVARVLCLELAAADGEELCDDVLNVEPGALVYLPAEALDVKVKYERTA